MRLVLAVCLCFSVSFAYLDPGSGSLLLSSVVAIFASFVFFIKNIFYKLTSGALLSGGFSLTPLRGGGHNHSLKSSIVFYCEGKQYYFTFKPILDVLDSIHHPYTYYTSGQDDPALERTRSCGEYHYIGTGNKAYTKLNTLRADICVLTAPGLDVLQIKRSSGVKHYCHIVHSLTPMTYRAFGLDYFDSVLVANEIQRGFVRDVECAHNVRPKHIGIIGSTYLDELSTLRHSVLSDKSGNLRLDFQSFASSKLHQSSLDNSLCSSQSLEYQSSQNTQKTTTAKIPDSSQNKQNQLCVLVSPSWGKETLLMKYGLELLEPLAQSGFQVIIRPHPQSLIGELESKNIAHLQDTLKSYDNISWDIGTPNVFAFAKADVMISDFSSVIFDFICLEGKPVLTLDFNFDPAGYDLADIDMQAFYTFSVLKKIGKKLKKSDFYKISEIIVNVLDSNTTKEIQKCKDELWSYPHKSGAQAVSELLRIERELLEFSLKPYMGQVNRIRELDSMIRDSSLGNHFADSRVSNDDKSATDSIKESTLLDSTKCANTKSKASKRTLK